MTTFGVRCQSGRLCLAVLLIVAAAGSARASLPIDEGLALHLDADAVVGLTSGQTIATWPDGSPADRDAIALGDPTWHADVLNGHAVVRLDGDDSFRAPLTAGDDMTVFVVAKADPYYSLVRWQGGGDWFVYHWGGGILIQSDNGALEGPATGLVANEWNLGAVVVDQGPAAGVHTYRNGALQGTWTYANAWTVDADLYIGSFNGAGEWTVGDIAEVIIYQRALSEAEHQQVGGYLAAKYALATTYPAATQAWGPQPAFDATIDSDWGALTWQPAPGASAHLVYFGTDEVAVTQADPVWPAADADFDGLVWVADLALLASQWLDGPPPGPGPSADFVRDGQVDLRDLGVLSGIWPWLADIPAAYAGAAYTPSFDPGPLADRQTYYWRVDEVIDGQVHRGPVWQFTCDADDAFNYGLAPPQHLYTVNRYGLNNAQLILLQSVQGIVAQHRPELFLLQGASNTIWLNDLKARYGVSTTTVEAIDGPGGPVPWCLTHWNLRDYVLCDITGEPASLTAAMSLAAAFDWLVVDVSLKSTVDSNGGVQQMDARGRTDKWVFDTYGDRFSDRGLFVQTTDAALGGAYLRDLPIALGALTWWNADTDDSVAVFDTMRPNAPVYGWDSPATPGELNAVMFHSQNDLYTVCTNWMLNLTVYAGLANLDAPITLQQGHRGRAYTPEADVHYVAFCMSDMDNFNCVFDGANWAQGSWRYGNSHRGEFAMGWGMPPSMARLGPSVVDWWYRNATPNDCFIGYSSGLGYFYPGALPSLDRHVAQLETYLARADLQVISLLDSWWPKDLTQSSYASVAEAYLGIDRLRGLFYADVYGDYARYHGRILWFNHKPLVTCRYVLWDAPQYAGVSRTGLELAQSINALPTDPTSPDGYTYVIVHAWTRGMDDVAACVANLDPEVRVVTPEELIEQLYLHDVEP